MKEIKSKHPQKESFLNNPDYISRIFLERITEFLPQYIFWKNKNSIYLGCIKNFANLFGLNSLNDIIGKSDKDLNWESQGHTAEEFIQGDLEVLDGNSIENREEILVLNGRKLITLVSKLPIVDESGKAIGIVGYFTDITKVRQSEEKIKQAELEAQAKFTQNAYSVAHDIRSPLSTLLMIVKNCKELPENERNSA